MSDETTLLPCPFCGSKNVETSYKDTFSGDFRRGVYCADCCGGIYPYYDTEAEAIAAWNTRATHGTLTAEQVREAAKSNSRQYESPVDDGVWITEYDWQAIAAELNGQIGGTCEQVLTDYDDGLIPLPTAHCSACGAEWGFTPRYCHNCGAKVVGTRDERKAVTR